MNGVNGMYKNLACDYITVRDIIRIIKRRIIILIIVPVIFAIIGALFSKYFVTPVYEATTTIIVSQSNASSVAISKGDVDLSKSLIYTYAEIAKSNTVLDNTKKILNLNILKSKTIFVSPVKDTQILKIKVQNTDQKLAMEIANTLIEQLALEIVRITSTDNVKVVDYAKIPENPVKPNVFFNTVVAGMIGEMIILLIIFLVEYFDNTIKSENDIEKYLNISLVGMIPNFGKERKIEYEYGKVYGESSSELNDN